MEFITPWRKHTISVSVTLQFDNADPFPISPDMYRYGDDPTVTQIYPRTGIIR